LGAPNIRAIAEASGRGVDIVPFQRGIAPPAAWVRLGPRGTKLLQDLNALVGYNLRRASQLLMGVLAEQLAELGLRVTEATVLVVLQSAPMSSQSDIGRMLSIKRANMTPLIAGLIARGLVKRISSSGRAHPLKLTRKGEELAARARNVMIEHDANYFGALSISEREWLTGFFSSVWRNAGEARDDAGD
jgi:DNA-binding MarR family transcriptional regulator